MPLVQGPYHETAEPGLESHSPISSSTPVDQSRSSQASSAPETPLAPHREHTAQVPRDYYVETPVVGIEAPRLSPPEEVSQSTSRHSAPGGSPNYAAKADDGTLGSAGPEPVLVDDAACSGLDIDSLNLKDANVMKKLVQTLQSRGILKQYGFTKENRRAAERVTTDPNLDTNPIHPFPCAHCGKTFPRNCELK